MRIMKNLRLVAFVVFGICAFCLPAQAQKQWSYKADNKKTSGRIGYGGEPDSNIHQSREMITITITQRPNGYEVSGYLQLGEYTCDIEGSYFTAGKRLRGKCLQSQDEDVEITGVKLSGSDAFQITVNGGHWGRNAVIVAYRNGIKPKTSETNVSETPF